MAKIQTESHAFLRGVEAAAVRWATECGLTNVRHGAAEVVMYPVQGHGIRVSVNGTCAGKERMATALFNERGERQFWQMDGVY